ncbi:hypothetical protein WISP_129904 [Willisornis vidua]|uniref:Uncharacterized protein n=1 Tax=Willisornis vidua TaxID=1566151 RepID=A0ABQ9CUM7_9PASS|nr:hypothetical protein WISP_129904 [Willisornis vidua]
MLLLSQGEKMQFDYAKDVLPQRAVAAWLGFSPALAMSSLECQWSVKNRTDGKCRSDQIPLSAATSLLRHRELATNPPANMVYPESSTVTVQCSNSNGLVQANWEKLVSKINISRILNLKEKLLI